MKLHLQVLLVLAAGVCASNAARILALMPLFTQSHANLMNPLVQELATRGHEVTYLTLFPLDKPGPNITQIDLVKLREFASGMIGSMGSAMFAYRWLMPFVNVLTSPIMGASLGRYTMQQEEVQALLHSAKDFDLILGEALMDEALLGGFSHKYKAPIVTLCPTHPNGWSNYMVGNPAPAATVPDVFLPFPSRMSLWQRTINTLVTSFIDMMYSVVHLTYNDYVMRELFGDGAPPLREMIKNTSLVLANIHHALAYPRPYVPNFIEIGGYHVPPVKPLPADLQKYLDESKNGVILFSLGSYIKPSSMSQDKLQALIGAFSKLKQDVLWKVDVDLEGLPKNVRTSKWLPQSDILAHPNLKLFITHGGLLSTTEAVHRGVPIVGVPVLGDQPANMKNVESLGFGKTLHYEGITEETVLSAVTEVLENPSYRITAQERSRILKDNIIPPMEKAMFWIEYVLRHKGAPHLRSAAQDLAWYQLYLLDVLAVLALAAAAGLTVQFYTARWLLRKLCGKKQNKIDKQKKKN